MGSGIMVSLATTVFVCKLFISAALPANIIASKFLPNLVVTQKPAYDVAIITVNDDKKHTLPNSLLPSIQSLTAYKEQQGNLVLDEQELMLRLIGAAKPKANHDLPKLESLLSEALQHRRIIQILNLCLQMCRLKI